MAQSPVETGSTPQTAEPTAPDLIPAREAGGQVETAGSPHAGHSLPEPSTTTTGDSAVGAELDRLLSGATNLDSLHRLTSQFLQPETRPEVSTGVPEKNYPEGPAQESEGHPEEVARAVAEGKPRPPRLRIASLDHARQDLIIALADPNRDIAEVLRGLAPASPQTVTVSTAAPATIPGLPAATSVRPLDPVALVAPTESSQALRDQIADLRQQRRTAQNGMDFETADALEDKIEETRARVSQVEQAERAHGQAMEHAYTASAQTVADLYPDTNGDTPLTREVLRLVKEAEKIGDPFLGHHDAPLWLASRAAANLGIAPRVAGAPTTPTAPLRPAPVAAPTPRAAAPGATPPAPAAGGARTQAPSPAADQAQFESTLDSAKDTNGILALTRLLG